MHILDPDSQHWFLEGSGSVQIIMHPDPGGPETLASKNLQEILDFYGTKNFFLLINNFFLKNELN